MRSMRFLFMAMHSYLFEKKNYFTTKVMKRMKNIYLKINLHVLHALHGFNSKSILTL